MSNDNGSKEPRRYYFVTSDAKFTGNYSNDRLRDPAEARNAEFRLMISAHKHELGMMTIPDFGVEIVFSDFKSNNGEWLGPHLSKFAITATSAWNVREVMNVAQLVTRRIQSAWEVQAGPVEIYKALMGSPLFKEVTRDWRDMVYRPIKDTIDDSYKLFEVIGVRKNGEGEPEEYSISQVFAGNERDAKSAVAVHLTENSLGEVLQDWVNNGLKIRDITPNEYNRMMFWNMSFMDKLKMVMNVNEEPTEESADQPAQEDAEQAEESKEA